MGGAPLSLVAPPFLASSCPHLRDRKEEGEGLSLPSDPCGSVQKGRGSASLSNGPSLVSVWLCKASGFQTPLGLRALCFLGAPYPPGSLLRDGQDPLKSAEIQDPPGSPWLGLGGALSLIFPSSPLFTTHGRLPRPPECRTVVSRRKLQISFYDSKNPLL